MPFWKWFLAKKNLAGVATTPIGCASVMTQYTVKPGQTLYFIEQTLADDKKTKTKILITGMIMGLSLIKT